MPQTVTDHAVYIRKFRSQLKFRKVLDEEFAIFPVSWLDQLPFEAQRLPFDLPRPDAVRPSLSDFHREVKIREKGLTVPVGGFVPLTNDFCNIVVDDRIKSLLKNFVQSRSTVLSPEDKSYFRCLAEINQRVTNSEEFTTPDDP